MGEVFRRKGEQFLEGPVDLVLLDFGLPEGSGPQTYEAIRAVAPDTPTLVLTGDAAEEEQTEER